MRKVAEAARKKLFSLTKQKEKLKANFITNIKTSEGGREKDFCITEGRHPSNSDGKKWGVTLMLEQ